MPLCGESDGDSPDKSDFVRVRARHGPRPGRRRPQTRRFPTPRRVRPPPDGNTTPAPDVRSVFFPAGPIMAGSTSGHGKLPRRRRRRVIRQDRSASGGPAQQVDTVMAVAFPATPSLRPYRRRPACSQLRIAPNVRRRENSIASLKDAWILLSNRVTKAVSPLDRVARNIVKSMS